MQRRKKSKNNKKKQSIINHSYDLEISIQSLQEKQIKTKQIKVLSETIAKELELDLSKYSNEIKEELRYLIDQILIYPSTQDAKIHQQANRLGQRDINKGKIETQQEEQSSLNEKICNCCGLKVQKSHIPMCTPFQNFPKVGISTYLFFQKIKNIIILEVILAFVFCSYTLYTNIAQPHEVISWDNYPRKISFTSKVQFYNSSDLLKMEMNIEGWLIVATVIIWEISMFVMKCLQIRYESMIDQATITAADFSIMIENIPISYTRQKLQEQFNNYREKIMKQSQSQDEKKNEIKPFQIIKFTMAVPHELLENTKYDEEIKSIQQEIGKYKIKFIDWIKELKNNTAFSLSQSVRKQQYQAYQKLIEKRDKIVSEKEVHQKQMYHKSFGSVKTSAFISFLHSESANIIDQMNPQSFVSRIRYLLNCGKKAIHFVLKDNQNQQMPIIVTRAPQPEDIIWENIGVAESTKTKRKIFTYFCTLLLLCGSFGTVYGLTILQLNYDSVFLSIAISVSLTVISIIIGMVIRTLNVYEKDFTQSNHQTSLAIKSILSQLANSILIPLITNLYVEENIYSQSGLVFDIFFLSLTNAFLPPFLRLFDIQYYFNCVSIWWQSRPYNKMIFKQSELNSLLELQQFQIGYQYIYFLDLFFFTCFYVTLQPTIIISTILGFICMYWTEKYCLLYRSKRPTPSSAITAQAMAQMISFGPIALSLGGMTWVHFLTKDYATVRFAAYLFSLGLGIFFFIVPINSVFGALFHVPDEEDLNYKQCRDKLTNEYDRLNPATAEAGLADYMQFIVFKKVISNIKNDGNKNLNEQVKKEQTKQEDIGNIFLHFLNMSKKEDEQKAKNLAIQINQTSENINDEIQTNKNVIEPIYTLPKPEKSKISKRNLYKQRNFTAKVYPNHFQQSSTSQGNTLDFSYPQKKTKSKYDLYFDQ